MCFSKACLYNLLYGILVACALLSTSKVSWLICNDGGINESERQQYNSVCRVAS